MAEFQGNPPNPSEELSGTTSLRPSERGAPQAGGGGFRLEMVQRGAVQESGESGVVEGDHEFQV